jgi:gas vesicle protein
MNSGKIILGALAGLAAGALIGVLFAPDKGSESRHKIVKKGEDYLDSVKNKFNSLLDTIAGKYNGGRVDVAESSGNGHSEETVREMQSSAS